MEWVRRNHTVIPWTLLAADLSIRLGTRLYDTYAGYYQDEGVDDNIAKSLASRLSVQEAGALPYPPDAYPGARDVASPYGSLRVYEWGPEDGRRIVMVHGITNPSVALGGVAEGLVDRGSRVILFDLPGRGYSAAPTSTPQSSRFFTTCILLAITSSPISWTGGNQKFALMGYSLGGGIAINFTSYFPSMVSSLIMLAPAGLIRTSNIQLTNKLLYNYGVLNETRFEYVIRRRLASGTPPIKPKKTLENTPLSGEIPPPTETAPRLSKKYPDLTISKVVPWQLEANPGFVRGYISSMRYGPITNQHEHWARVGQRLNAERLNAEIGKTGDHDGGNVGSLQNGKVLIICGKHDDIVIGKELKDDAAKCLGEENFEVTEMDAGHDLPVKRSKEIVEYLWEFWHRRWHSNAEPKLQSGTIRSRIDL